MEVVGVVHLPPLPGSPRAKSIEEVVERARRDAARLEDGGVDAVLVENFGDTPYYPDDVPKITVACMTRAVAEVVDTVSVPVGVNVLRNDGVAAVDVCAATGASFIRVNAYVEAVATDQGVLQPVAHMVWREIDRLGVDVEVYADIRVKHGRPLDDRPVEEVARDAVERGLADAVIVTGSATGSPPRPEEVRKVARVVDRVLVGSGVTPENAHVFLRAGAAGFIVGTYFKKNGITENPVDVDRVRELVRFIRRSGVERWP
ncbi:BtpA/SgcQ family protein [Methanopyrus kandleri]|uniref:BtpA/SgcQ family protein n=1 Tax=Methanopyrus kandleri TaxID=2320 RepID=UPI000A84947E|nr:BtpA/SgcQ family protein [Methanopyrus kandleri]